MFKIRFATFDDLAAILEISNWAATNTAANFAIEPETLKEWQGVGDAGAPQPIVSCREAASGGVD